MNDPNGPIFHDGQHHLFYQYNPTDWHWGNLHWGHAVSRDLLHWEELEPALYPHLDKGETHCYSGCSYIKDGKIELFYTSVGQGKRCQNSGSEHWVATTENHVRWNQIPENPVLTLNDNGGKKLTEWRDPFVFSWKGGTYALIAGIVHDEQQDVRYSAVHIYRSADMRRWEYLAEFYRNDDPQQVIECPNLVVWGDKVLFIHSVWNIRVLQYFVGTISADYRLLIHKKGQVDYGDFFASQISFTPQDDVLLWGWLREDPRRGLLTDGEWAGVQAIPRVISLDEEDNLLQRRLPGVESLRREEETVSLRDFSGEHRFATASHTAEITAVIASTNVFTLRVLASDDGREYTDIVVNPREGTYYAPMEESSLLMKVDKRPILGYFPPSDHLELDILVDCSVVEIFIGNRSCMTLRVYPTLEGSGMALISASPLQSADIHIYKLALDGEAQE